MVLGALADATYVAVQLESESIQEDGLNVPPALPSLHDTVPVGVDEELEVSATLAVNVTCDP